MNFRVDPSSLFYISKDEICSVCGEKFFHHRGRRIFSRNSIYDCCSKRCRLVLFRKLF